MGLQDVWVQVPVRGWATDWVRNLGKARGHQVVLSEQVRDSTSDEFRALLFAKMGRKLRDEAIEYAEREGLVVLAYGAIDQLWSNDLLQARLRFLAIEQAPVPPVEEWV